MVRRKARASPPTVPTRKRRTSSAGDDDEFEFDDDDSNQNAPAATTDDRRSKATSSQRAAGRSSRRREGQSEADDDAPMSSTSPVAERAEGAERPASAQENQQGSSKEEFADALRDLADQQNRNDSMMSDEGAPPVEGDAPIDLLSMKIPEKPEPIMRQDGSGQRLMITNITVDNFKSYYGRQILGPFHQNFTAIVGPNGSGKSNVIDSLVFVFGFRANRIRTKKLSGLIHSSAGHENLSSCTVEVHFQKIIDKPDGSYEVIPNTAFVVSRSAFRSGSSEYRFNGKVKDFKEIAALLAGVGIDLVHNRFLILQGEVEQIALMKPKAEKEGDEGMLEYLEDIIGSSRLKAPIEKLHAHIEVLQEERSTQLARVKSAEKEKNDLEGPMKEVLSYLETENAIARLNNKLNQKEKQNASEQLKKVEVLMEEKATLIEKCEEDLVEVKKSQEARKEAIKALEKEHQACLAEEEKAKAAFRELEQRDTKVRADMKRLKEKAAQLEVDIKKESKKLPELREKPERAMKEKLRLEEAIADADAAIKENQAHVDENLEALADATAEPQQRKKKHEEALAGLVERENKSSSDLTIAQDEMQMLVNEEEKEQRKAKEIKDQLEDSEQKLEDSKTRLTAAKKRLTQVEEEVTTTEDEVKKLKTEEETLATSVHDKRVKFNEARSSHDQSQSRNNIVRALMEQKRLGKLPGVYGRLGDLGAIDATYDVAISTTCGQLENIVVDTIDTAQQCIEFIKRENLGRTTLIALDKQQHLVAKMKQAIRTPEDVPRLFDLIQVKDPDVLPAFYYALRDTLVVENISRATKISMPAGSDQRWRVVTLKGEVVDVSGTMTGGGQSQSRGRIGQRVAVDTAGNDKEREMAALGATLQQDEARLTELRQKKNDAQTKLARLTTEINGLRSTVEQLARDVKSTEQKIGLLKSRLAEQTEKAKATVTDKDMLKRSRANVEALEKERDEAAAAANAVRAKVAEVQAEIQAISDKLVGIFQKALDAARRTKANAEKEIAKELAAASNSKRLLDKAEKRIADLESDLKESQTAYEEAREEFKGLENEAGPVLDQQHNAQQQTVDAKCALDEARAKRTDIDDREQQLDKQLAEQRKELATIEQTKKSYLKHIETYNHKLSKLTLHNLQALLPLRQDKQADQSMEDSMMSGGEGEEGEGKVKKEKAKEQTEEEEEEEQEQQELMEDERESAGELRVYSPEEMAAWDQERLIYRLTVLENRKSSIKTPNVSIVSDYKRKLEKYQKLVNELDAISSRRDKHRQLHDKLKKQRMNEFMEGFSMIGLALKEMYQMITLGGDASLDLVDSLDPFSEGVAFSVRPPKKSWKQITNLSGGEKTLSSLALVFALHSYKPTPLYVMDEIDAALDFRNVSIIAHYIKDRTKNAQFIIISLRNNMFELGNRLVGIYKT
uniref:Structural maintenance of chromosomes protein n=1 Tax=Plectus sambesii TaxID=2011161 RepID=A0A914WBW6_9BILA